MIDPSEVELAAMRQCLKSFGEGGGRDRLRPTLGTTPRPKRYG